MAYIVFEDENEKTLVELDEEKEFLVGRVATCDLRFSSKDRVSRQHCVIYFSEQSMSFVVEDLGSTNGTFVNGMKINRPISLHNKDQILVGLINLFYFEDIEDATDTERKVNKVAVPVKTFGLDDVFIGTNTESITRF